MIGARVKRPDPTFFHEAVYDLVPKTVSTDMTTARR